jgi:phosphoribosylglycinamide formyltransferase 2
MGEVKLGTPGHEGALRLMLLGSGELGREVALEASRLGVEVIAVDRYAGAPAMRVADRWHAVDMQDADALRALVEAEDPNLIVPEIEAIATDLLLALEEEGRRVIPTARATLLTMDRERIRALAAEELGLRTSRYAFADDLASYREAVAQVGLPCVVKPVMSSSGKGQSIVHEPDRVDAAWEHALAGSRGASARVIVEEFIAFETEITLLTIRHAGGTSFCDPIGHVQIDGDYRESWQPEPLSKEDLHACQEMARAVTDALGGHGLFGVEFFITADEVVFSELSPRPHDTGMVTMATQQLSEFALHVRAILGVPVHHVTRHCAGASVAILSEDDGGAPSYTFDPVALDTPGADLRLFAKPSTRPGRRMGVALGAAATVEEALDVARAVAQAVTIHHTSTDT